jgi:hypothetical protein
MGSVLWPPKTWFKIQLYLSPARVVVLLASAYLTLHPLIHKNDLYDARPPSFQCLGCSLGGESVPNRLFT